MIIVQLKGGLGNQLFQYAAGLSLAVHHGVDLAVDIAGLGKRDEEIGTVRQFDLAHLAEPPAVASPAEISEILRQSISEKYFQKLIRPYRRKVYKEASFSFDPDFFRAGKHIYLKGYRQSEKYFSGIQDLVKEQFVFKPSLYQHLQEFAAALQDHESVAIHVRRGDYDNKNVDNYYAKPGASYYNAGINEMRSRVNDPTYYVFTDDPKWVEENLELPGTYELVSGSVTNNHIEDFYLLTQCRHNIIANSSFSWWGAWLNPNPDKVVVVPDKWFDKAPLNTKDLVPDGWLKC